MKGKNKRKLNETLRQEFKSLHLKPVLELQIRSGLSYGTCFKILEKGEAPAKEVTRKLAASAFGVSEAVAFPFGHAA